MKRFFSILMLVVILVIVGWAVVSLSGCASGQSRAGTSEIKAVMQVLTTMQAEVALIHTEVTKVSNQTAGGNITNVDPWLMGLMSALGLAVILVVRRYMIINERRQNGRVKT